MNSCNPPSESYRLTDDQTHRLPVRILCIEDNEGDFGLLRAHLREARFDPSPSITRAKSLAEALQRLMNRQEHADFDIVLLDLCLPDSQGVDTFHRIRSADPSIAIAILSGNDDHDLAIDLVQQGAQDYLPKDALTPDVLMRCIIYAMKRQRYRVKLEKVTARLQRTTEELKLMQTQLMQVEKIDSLGRLASSVAHEVKNPLAAIQMGIDYLTMRCADTGEDVTQTLGIMQDAVSRADTIIHDMLHFSRTEDIRLVPCDLNELVNKTLRMLKHEVDRRHIDIKLALSNSLAETLGDQSKLEQVLVNVIMNSIQAMAHRGLLEIRTYSDEASDIPRDEGLREMNAMKTGDAVSIIEIRDHGPGIPDEIMTRIFEPFFTTKATGEGTGLGLSVCKRIVELHRGQMQVTNMPEHKGTLVRIILKAHSVPDKQQQIRSAAISLLTPLHPPL